MVKTRRSTAPEEIVVPKFSNELTAAELQYNRQHTALCKSGCQIVHHELVLAIDITTNYRRTKDKENPSFSKLIRWRRKVTELNDSLNRWCLTAGNVNSTVPDGEELLRLPVVHLACVLLKHKALSLFLESGFDPAVTADNGDNALFSFVRTFATARLKNRQNYPKRESSRQVANAFCTIVDFLTNKEPRIFFAKDRDGKNILQLLVDCVTETIHDIRDSSKFKRREGATRSNLPLFTYCAKVIIQRISRWRDAGKFKEGLLIGFLNEVDSKGWTVLECLEQDNIEYYEVQELVTYLLECFPGLKDCTTPETTGCDWQEEEQIPYVSLQQQGNYLMSEVNTDLLAVAPVTSLSTSSAEETQQELSLPNTSRHSCEQQVLIPPLRGRGTMGVTGPASNTIPAANVSLFQQATKGQMPPFVYYVAGSPSVFTMPPSLENQTQIYSGAYSLLEQRRTRLQLPVASHCDKELLYLPNPNANLHYTGEENADNYNLDGSKEIPISASMLRSTSIQDPAVAVGSRSVQSSFYPTEVPLEEGRNIPGVGHTESFEAEEHRTAPQHNFLQCSSTQSQSETLGDNSEHRRERRVVQSDDTAAVGGSGTQQSSCASTAFPVALGSPVQQTSGTRWRYANNSNTGNTLRNGQDNPRKKIRLDTTPSRKMCIPGRSREKTSPLSTGNPLKSVADSPENTLAGRGLNQPHRATNNEDMIATITSSTKSPEPPTDNSLLYLIASQSTSLTPDTKEEMVKLMRRDFNRQLDSVQTKLTEVIRQEQGVDKQIEDETKLLRLKEEELESLRSQVNQCREIAKSLRKSRCQLEKERKEWQKKLLQCDEIQEQTKTSLF